MLDSEKLRTRREFLRLRKQGKFFVTRGFCVEFALMREGGEVLRAEQFSTEQFSMGCPSTRFGVTASRKVGGAVSRNRAKRRLRAAWRNVKQEIKTGFDINLIATKATPHAKWQDIEKGMNFFIRKNQLLKKQCSTGKKHS